MRLEQTISILFLLTGIRQVLSRLSQVSFYVISDTPFGSKERSRLASRISDQVGPRPQFVIHLGNQMERQVQCQPDLLRFAVDVLSRSIAVPVLMLPGDHDWYVCSDREWMWENWKDVVLKDELEVEKEQVHLSLERDDELFAFQREGILFVGVHLLDATAKDRDEFDSLVKRSAEWMASKMQAGASDGAKSVVLFGHAEMKESLHKELIDTFQSLAHELELKALFVHGNGSALKFSRNNNSTSTLSVPRGTFIRVDVDSEYRSPFKIIAET